MKRLLVLILLISPYAWSDDVDQALLMYLLANPPNRNAWVQPLQNLADTTKENSQPDTETVCETQTRTLLSGKTITRTVCK